MATVDPPRDDRSFIVDFWAAIFGALRRISLLGLIRAVGAVTPPSWGVRRATSSTWFVDAWALGHLALAGLSVLLVTAAPTSPLSTAFALYGIFRTFEIVVVQLNIILFDQYRARREGRSYSLRGYLRSVLLLLQNFAEIVFWFAAAYASFGQAELAPRDLSVAGLLRESFLTTVSFGSAAPEVVGSGGLALVAWQGLVGLLVTILSLARFVGLLPRPDSRERDDVDVGTATDA